MMRCPPPLSLAILTMALLAAVKLAAIAGVAAPSLAVVWASTGRTVLPSATAAEPTHGAPARAAPTLLPGEAMPAPPVAAAAPAPGPSDTERAVLLDLRARREALDARQAALEARDGLLKAAERGLTDRLDQLTAIQTHLEAMEKSRRELDEANWRGLVKTYETMRARDAAVIFNDLDDGALMQVLDRMKESKAAAILAGMQPDRARAATMHLMKWRARSAGGEGG